MRRRRLAIPAPSTLLVSLVVLLAFAQIGAALVDGHGTQLDARTHGRTRKWRGRQLIGLELEVEAGLVISSPTLLSTPVAPVASSAVPSSSTTPASAVSSVGSTIASSSSVSTTESTEPTTVSSAQTSSVADASSSSPSASSAEQSSAAESILSSLPPAASASSTASPSSETSIAPVTSASETSPSPLPVQSSPQEPSSPIASSPLASPAPVESSPSAMPSATPTSAVSEPAPSSDPSAPSAAQPSSAVDNEPSAAISSPSLEPSSAPPPESSASVFLPIIEPSSASPSEPATSASESSPTPSPTSAAAVVQSSDAASTASSDGGLAQVSIGVGIGESSEQPPQSSSASSGAQPSSSPPSSSGPVTNAVSSPGASSSSSVQQNHSPSPASSSVSSPGGTASPTSDVILQPEPSSSDVRPSPIISTVSPSPSASQSSLDQTWSSFHPTASGTYGATVAVPSASESSASRVMPSGGASDANSVTLIGTVSAPGASGSQVVTFTDTASASAASASANASASDWQQSASRPPASSSSFNDAYTPSQTWLIVATPSSQSSAPTQEAPSRTITQSQAPGASISPSLPATASIPSSVPTLIVPANSVVRQANVGTGGNDDPVKDDVLISLLLSGDNFPWLFVVKSSDATSQLFNTFPALIAGALNITESDVKTYGLMVYQPASWNGLETSLLTQWLAYIPKGQFDTLSAYLKASNSPLFNQPGIKGQLAAQINTAYPLAATTGNNETTSKETGEGSSAKKRNIIIGVCVAVGGLLWVGLVFWIYKRVKRSNEKAVHRRLSEHMSMFDGGNHATYGAAHENRLSRAVSIAASDVDDRPSSFYASPLDNDRSFRQYQRERSSDALASVRTGASLGHDSPNNQGPSVFGNSWFANPSQGPAPTRTRAQNPFEDMVQQSFLNTSGSNGNIQHHVAAQRRSQGVQKGMISQPTLQAHSLEFGKEF